MVKWKNSSDQKQHALSLKSSQELYVYGQTPEKSILLQQKEVIEDTTSMNSSSVMDILQLSEVKKTSVTQEYPLIHKKKIWIHNKNYLKSNSLITQSSQILVQASTLKEKGYCSYWNNHSKVISTNLSLPTKIDYVDLDSKSSLKSSNLMAGKSWFCMMKKSYPQNKNSLEISSLLQPFLAPDCTGYEVIHSKDKLETLIKKEVSGKKYKTIKIPIFPTENEKVKLLHEAAQFKWYYNACIDIYNMEENNDLRSHRTLSKITLRDRLKLYYYEEESKSDSNLIFCSFQRREKDNREYPRPTWIEDHNGNNIKCEDTLERVIRGAIACFTGNINSSISNKVNGNIKNFNLKYRTSKSENDYIVFDDGHYPVFHRKIKGVYSYRYNENSSRHRTRITWNDLVCNYHKNVGISILYDKLTNKWHGCIPVERTWFPPKDHRSENQRNVKGEEAIGLDPGMRKFLTGMTSKGESITVGKDAYKQITPIILSIDKIESKLRRHRNGKEVLNVEEVDLNVRKKQGLWGRVKNLIQDMHWKTVNYLTTTYKYIFLEDFKVQSCIKGNLPSRIKRILNQYSFHQFKTRLQYGSEMRGCKLINVHSALTSKVCCNCGNKNDVGASEEYTCETCHHTFDRDENAGINMIIKGLTAIMQ